jgi:hypothetical protein
MAIPIYFALSRFHPALFKQYPSTDDYSEDRNFTFFVIQAFCKSDNLKGYFKDNLNPNDIAYHLLTEKDRVFLETDILNYFPVPLPPKTDLRLDITTEGNEGSLSFTHATTEQTYFRLKAAQWAQFAILSQSIPFQTKFDKLTDRQKHSVYQAILAMAVQMHQEAVHWNSICGDEDPRCMLWRDIKNIPNIQINDIQQLDCIPKLYSGLSEFSPIESDISGTKIPSSLPRYEWDLNQLLQAHPNDPFTDQTYLEHLWEALRKVAQRDDKQLEETLNRLFFFGERLAWPIEKKDGGHPFMVLRPNLDGVSPEGLPSEIKSKDWFITNAVSLMGLVFRIPIAEPDSLSNIQAFSLAIANTPFTFTDDMIKKQNLYSKQINSVIDSTKPTIAINELQRTILFTPRQAPLLQLKVNLPGEQQIQTFFVVGEALLDVSDTTARFAPASPGSLPGRATRTIGLKMSEVAGLYVRYSSGTSPAEWIEKDQITKCFQCFQRIHADLKRLPWSESLLGDTRTSKPASFYELRRNEMVPSNMLELPSLKKPSMLCYLSSSGTSPINQSLKITAENFTADPSRKTSLGIITANTNEQPILEGIIASSDQRVTLLFETPDDSHFDLLLPKNNSIAEVFLVLNHAGVSRLGLSTDRLALSLYAMWNPNSNQPIPPSVNQAAETDKLRLHLRFNEEPQLSLPLSNPDALLPLPPPDKALPPWEESQKQHSNECPQAAYWLAHHFDQSTSISEGRPTIDEGFRYLLWNNAGKPAFELVGYFEHQYGHRIELKPDVDLDLKRTVDIVNPASVFFGQQKEGDKQTLFPLLRAVEDPEDFLVIGFSELAIQHAYQHYIRTVENTEQIAGDPFSDLRSLYRALSELRDAITNKSASLVIEGWTFDNRGVLGFGKGVTFADGLIQVEPPTMIKIGSIPSGPLFESLDQSLDHFVAAIKELAEYIEGGNALLPLTDPIDISPLAAKASVLRVGLKINRHDSLKATWDDWKDAMWAFLPSAKVGNNAELHQYPPTHQRNQLITNAKSDLEKYLSPDGNVAKSYFHESLYWLLNPLMDHYAPLLGPAASSFLRPTKKTELALPSIESMTASYILYAFMLPKADPSIGDRQSTFEFACFLLLLIEDIIEGRSICDRISLQLDANTTYHTFRNEVLGMLPFIADRLIELLQPVFNNHAQNDLPEVRLFKEWWDWKDESNPHRESPREAIKSLLLKQPSLFQTSRGIGFIAFTPEAFSPEFYRLQLRKTIFSDYSLPDKSDTQYLQSFDIEAIRGKYTENNGAINRFAYFIDPLPDHQYDDGFIIKDSLVYRSEDVIKQQVIPNSKEIPCQLSIKAVFTSPGSSNEPLFLLPERRLPPLPRPVRVKATSDTDPDPDSTQSLLWKVSHNSIWPYAYSSCTKNLKQLSLGSTNAHNQCSNDQAFYSQFATSNGNLNLKLPSASLSSISEEWKYLTSSLAHFYFAFDLQFSSNPNETYFDLLKDLVIEIETEMWCPEPPSSDLHQQASGPTTTNSLFTAFSNHRSRKSGQDTQLLSLQEENFLTEIETLLINKDTTLLQPMPEPQEESHDGEYTKRKKTIKSIIRYSRDDNEWCIKNYTDPRDSGYCCVVGFEILPQVSCFEKHVDIDCSPDQKLSSAILRLSVLDHPFYVTRARLRVLRNWTDLNCDHKPDMNPCFILSHGYSPWACEGRKPVVINLRDNTAILGNPPETCLTINVDNAQNFLEVANFDASGFLIDMLFPNGNNNSKPWPKEFLQSPDYDVTASICRTIEDVSVRFGTEPTSEPIPSRSITTVRQILRAKGNELPSLLEDLSPVEIGSLFPWIQLSWRDSTGHPLLTIEADIKIVNTPQQ